MCNNEKFITIGKNLDIFISKQHGFGTDACLLTWFSKFRHDDIVCDLGTGCGIIPFLIYMNFKVKRVDGIEIQEKAVFQFSKSIEKNNLNDRIKSVHADIKNIENYLKKASYSKVISNPPYKKVGSGIKNKDESAVIARHEVYCGIYDICKAASYLLKDKGELYLCQRPERLKDVLISMSKNKIEPRNLQFVAKEEGSAPWLFLISGVKNGGENLKVLPNFNIYENGNYSSDANIMYKTYSLGSI